MTPILVVLTSLLIRIAIPALLMIGLVLLLRRLDAHWQEEAIYQQKMEAENPLEHTWEMKGCSIEGMSINPALHSTEPCWQVFRKSNGYLHEECLRCKVFRATPVLLPN
jgi:hypothetical protein